MVIFNELFEHLRINPIFTMREIHRVLKPGGRLMLSTPSLRSLRGLANLLLKDKSFSVSANLYEAYEKLEWLGHMGHVREYTATEVTVFLDRLGFDIDALVFRGRDPNNLINRIIGVFPALKPFVTYVARRRETV